MKRILLVILLIITLLSCRENIIEFQEEVKTGRIYLSSFPSGAEIYFENSRTGKVTPDSLTSLLPGSYSIKLRLPGYAEESVNVNVQSGVRRFINVSLRLYY
ncbi:MAG: hypothetical protein CVV24_03310 [Ignavibacteriae bacterium HGW-Ignavibacteriae-3]|nr:MAG: hypothetical protein CVV24_03310 [Ignavibacteriae bacterium HGW-Ignavibacteriae-3]